MHRGAYEYTSPLNNSYSSNRFNEFDQYGQLAQNSYQTDPRFSPSNYHTQPNYPQRLEHYEGNNDTTLRAEERNWYAENSTIGQNYYTRNLETLPRTSKEQQKQDDKKQPETENGVNINGVTRRAESNARFRRKEDRCSCECWPTNDPENLSSNDINHSNKSVHQSAVDMVASYGVYQNPQDDDDQSGFVRIANRGYPYQNQHQGVVVNEVGDSSVVPRADPNNARNSKSVWGKCCGFLNGGSDVPAGQEADCWITCCKPAIFLILVVLMLVVFALVSGLLVYYNYMTYKPRQQITEENNDSNMREAGSSSSCSNNMIILEDDMEFEIGSPITLEQNSLLKQMEQIHGEFISFDKQSTQVDSVENSTLDEPCEKTFCRWGASCIVGSDGRAQCQCPARCPNVRDPVCSTDGRTYHNHCELRKESCERRLNTRVRHIGECELNDPCRDVECPWGATCTILDGRAACRCPRCGSRSMSPVCGSDSKEYNGPCDLAKTACEQQLNITLLHHGKCDPCADFECPPPQVCQLDGLRSPTCRCGEICPLSLDPVCASDGRTYANECELRQEACRSRRQMRIIYRGKCSSGVNPCSSVQCGPGEHCWIGKTGAASCDCGPDCEPILRHVCGRDGITYQNACHARRIACQEGRILEMAYEGACGSAGPCSNQTCPFGGECQARSGRAICSCPSCSSQLEPVCGSDGRTYANECKLRERACQQQNDNQQRDSLVQLYNGTCESCDDKKCEFYGVCEMESPGRTKCVCPGNCSEELTTQSKPDSGNILEASLVCGSDGQTYASECHLKSAACQLQRNISVAYNGDCAMCENVVCKFGARCSAGECICPTDCSESDDEPICSNTMVTYSSECELQKAACGMPKHKPLHVIFYGDCKDRFAVAGPPIALTTALPLPFPPTHSEQELENTTSLPIFTDFPDQSLSTLEQLACKDIHCDYDATCELGSDNFPRCSCLFDCPLDETSEDYFPVCASDLKLYTSMCAMRMEGCHKQIELRLRPLELCKGLEARPCAGGSPVRDSDGRDVDCGGGPSRQDCPTGSYCHHTATTARCCFKNETLLRKQCEESRFGCCPDKRTPAGGPGHAGCPSSCGCHRLGALTDTCDPETKQCSCRPGVGGLRCDRCEPGYWGLPRIGAGHKGCIPCGCSMFGSVREDCEQMTGRCVCKPGIQGQKCTMCTNPDEVLGPNGCFNAETGAMAPKSCSDIVCYFGAVCVESDGRASCQCPAASCPTDSTDPTMLVCGSDGQTYPSECHLKLQACRTQEDVVVQAFGICKGSEDITGTALPSKHYSPLQFTQQDDNNFPSKSTRHLLVPDHRNYHGFGRNYDAKEKESTSSLDGDRGMHRGYGSVYRPTPATVRAPPALVGDLCNNHADCLVVPNSRCSKAACVCQPGHKPAPDRRECLPTNVDYVTTEEPQACYSEPCMNGGTCIDLPESSYACICEPRYTGDTCQQRISLPGDAHYIETPSFDGKAYMRLKPLKAYHKLNIDVEFKTFSENGVILYDQQKYDGTGDFVSLAIVNGFVEFRYNLGDGIVVLTSLEKVSLNEYHKVSAKRYHRDGILSVDDMEDVVGQSMGSLKALDLSEDTYIGSVPTNFTKVFDNIGTKQGFTGCVKHLRIIRHQVTKKIGREDSAILAMENVRECTLNPCVSAPCLNGATCQVADGEMNTYVCICSGGYRGMQCEEKLDPCESNPCGSEEGVICDAAPEGSYVCKCLFGGRLINDGVATTCVYDVMNLQETNVPEFNGSSYLQLPKLDGLSNVFHVEVWFLTRKLSGMIFYNSQSNKAKGDFISINLVNGYIQFRFNLGSGIANITFPEKVSKDKWHKVRASRTGREGILKLDNWPAVKGYSAPPLTELNLGQPLFLGSLPLHTRPHRLSGIMSSFVGAIQQVFVNSIPLILYNDDIAQCSMMPNEEVLPCATPGVSKFSGYPCSSSANPCQHNGVCVPMLNEYKCVCKDGFDGRNCESKLVAEIVDNNTPVRFNGEDIHAYRSRGSRRKYPEFGMRFDIKFRTTESSGLLIWRKKGGIGNGDFMALGIVDGHAELVFSDYASRNSTFNHKERWFGTVRSKIRVDDGQWHTVVVKRRKRMALIQTDGQPSTKAFAQLPILIKKANPKIWIGGAPSLPHGLPPQLYFKIKGCISFAKFNGRQLDLHKPINSKTTVEKC